jgi:predicted nucleic acid-binding protein
MGLIVSDTSTLIHLAAIDQLDLLEAFFECVTIPPAVWREVVEQGQGRAGALEVEQARRAGWIKVAEVTDLALLRLLKRDLDDGEAEVITLAIEQGADLVLLDEADARATADLYELSKTGIIGLLIRAKQEGYINLLKPELDKLLHQGGFWIEEGLYRRVLDAVEEAVEGP